MKTLKSKLEKNNNLRSSTLGKELAAKVLDGDSAILEEAEKLIKSKDENIRAGAAKIFEIVAEKKPELVKKYLASLLSQLSVKEAQTRWMIIRTFGLCSTVAPEIALQALDKARMFIENPDSGACLWNRTIFYLGNIGSLSRENSKKVFPILETAIEKVPRQENAILDAFQKIFNSADKKIQNKILKYAGEYAKSEKNSTQKRATKLLKAK